MLTVAATVPIDYFIENGVFYGSDGARTLFRYPLALDRLYVSLRPGTDADQFAADVQATFLANGTEAVSIPTIMDEGYTMTRQIFQLFQGYLAMGLIVGIAGTAVVMVRAVRERRRQIGTLRALGFGSRSVGRSFAIETGFVAAEGTVIGAALALVTLYDIVALSDSFGQMTLLDPVRLPGDLAPRHRGRVAPGDGLADDRGEPDPAGGRAPDDRLTVASASVDLVWLPLGAGGHSVRLNGRVYEAVAAQIGRRRRCALYHSALDVSVPEGRFVIEMAPIPDADGRARGVVAEGAVGSRRAGGCGSFATRSGAGSAGPSPTSRRRWTAPAASPTTSSVHGGCSPWCRSSRHRSGAGTSSHAGEMWNSNSLVSWLLGHADFDVDAISPPPGGRAPGWNAGLVVARRERP